MANQSFPNRWTEARFEMVDKTIVERGVNDERVIAAMRTAASRVRTAGDSPPAYEDDPLPIGFDSTISQAYIVATDDRALATSSPATRCSRSAPAAATKPRCSR